MSGLPLGECFKRFYERKYFLLDGNVGIESRKNDNGNEECMIGQ